MSDLYNYPFPDNLEKIKDLREDAYNAGSDGFDLAYCDGVDVVLKVLKNWDGGISENYLRGIKEALEIYEERG